jgi:type II secretory pathway predicted ATPase ExeA
MPADQLLTYLADQLTGQYSPITATIDQSVRRIERLLQSNAQTGNHAIIAIDEAHLLNSGKSLEAIRLLMNFQLDGQPLATFVLAGQNEPGAHGASPARPRRADRRIVRFVASFGRRNDALHRTPPHRRRCEANDLRAHRRRSDHNT